MYHRNYGRFKSSPPTSVLDFSFVPVDVLSQRIELFRMAYPGDESFRLLRSQYPQWSFWRSGETVYMWSGDFAPLPEALQASPTQVTPVDNPPLISAMILQAFEREMVSMGFTLVGHKHKCFVNLSKGNLLAGAGVKCFL